jgi:hypothetical protein
MAIVLPLGLSGCGYTLSEFARPVGNAAATPGEAPRSNVATALAVPLQPTALVETDTRRATSGAESRPNAGAYPNINVVPPEPKGKLLTPEEKAKVIAELEALARSQGASMERSRDAARDACADKAAKKLDPEARLKLEQQGMTC